MSTRSQPPTQGAEPLRGAPWSWEAAATGAADGAGAASPSPTREGKRRPPPKLGRPSCPRLTCPLCPAPAGSAGLGRWQRKLPEVGGEERRGGGRGGSRGSCHVTPPLGSLTALLGVQGAGPKRVSSRHVFPCPQVSWVHSWTRRRNVRDGKDK